MPNLAASIDPIRLAALLIIFAGVVTLALWAMQAISRKLAIKGELRRLGPESALLASATHLRTRALEGAWAQLVNSIEKAGLSLADTSDERLVRKLRMAGFTAAAGPRIFTLARIVLLFALPLTYAVLALGSTNPPSTLRVYVIGSILGLLGLYLPNLYVQARADRRRDTIVNGFPDALDLLLVCVEAGLGIEAAMDRVGRELVLTHPLVAQLLTEATLRLRAGASREEAFRTMADNAAVDEIRSFTTLLIQSDRLGTSLATTLRVYADEMREKRRMRAEEKAHRLPVLISIPLVTCMLPVMIGVLMLPAAIRVVRKILPMMLGG